MTASVTLPSASLLPLSSSNNNDLALKPNPHPYAIKTTHTALLSRSNSSGHNTPSKYFYTPPAGTPSSSPMDHRHEYRGHRYSTSLTGVLPSPLPSPLGSPAHSQRSQSEHDSPLCRARADTLPTYLSNSSNPLCTEPEEDLPPNPKTWAPSQLSVYLTTALRIRSGEHLPERVTRDIASWVRREGVSGRTFLRWTDEDLKALGINTLWRSALLVAARNLRQNVLRGRIWGNRASDQEQEQKQDQEQDPEQDDALFGTALYASSSSSLDLPLVSEDADTGSVCRPSGLVWASTNENGRVRGMVDKWERESARSRGSSCNSSSGRRGSESDSGSEVGEREVAAAEDVGSGGTSNDSRVMSAAEEPSIEDLLAAEPAPPGPKDGSWGARAWEELDIGVTIRRIEAHDTVDTRRDGSESSGASTGSARSFLTRSKHGGRGYGSSRRVRDAADEDVQTARRMVADIFAETADMASTPALADAEVQADADVEAEPSSEADLEEQERAMENEVSATRSLLEEFRRRLEEVEARVGAMEVEWHAEEEQRMQAHIQQWQAQGASAVEKDMYDKAVEALPEEAGTMLQLSAAFVTPPAEAVTEEGEETEQASEAEDGTASTDSESRVPCHAVDLGPTTLSDLPSYVLFVGLGVCAVVLQVVLKRVAWRSLKP